MFSDLFKWRPRGCYPWLSNTTAQNAKQVDVKSESTAPVVVQSHLALGPVLRQAVVRPTPSRILVKTDTVTTNVFIGNKSN